MGCLLELLFWFAVDIVVPLFLALWEKSGGLLTAVAERLHARRSTTGPRRSRPRRTGR